MSKTDRKIIIILLLIIITFSCILIYKIKSEPKYNKDLYKEIYTEYEQLFEKGQEKVENYNKTNYIEKDNKIYMRVDSHGKKYRVLGEITIPKIGIQYPIINETSDEYLKIAPAKLFGPDINDVGNFCIVGHNYENDQFFSKLSELDIGDKIYLSPNRGKNVIYKVYNKYEINENDMNCTNQDTNGNIELTLITCTKKKKNRLVVKAKA